MSSGSGRDNVGITWPLLRPDAPQPGSAASTTATSTPASRRCNAVDSPLKPPPITTTSASSAPCKAGNSGPGPVTACQRDFGQETSVVVISIVSGDRRIRAVLADCILPGGDPSILLLSPALGQQTSSHAPPRAPSTAFSGHPPPMRAGLSCLTITRDGPCLRGGFFGPHGMSLWSDLAAFAALGAMADDSAVDAFEER